ncbi:hypothetical protein [Pseudofrankia sp. DC12]|uniref:hypothetical protein n=1 Tax=Pseudofrankia sp. DC12 TaxID=683315 RepID=UPI0005F7D122|nr:hypothetical protein [Pseudofrankia sp. DC12]
MKLRWRGGRRTATASAPRGGTVHDEFDGPDDDGLEDLPDLAGSGGEARPTGGPVLLTLTTREQVEQAAAAEAAPKMIRVRPGRGAFGGLASSGGCANPNR